MAVVDLCSEITKPSPNLSHGELLDSRTGCIIARLPASGAPCDCERDTKGRAAVECLKCGGSGFTVFRRPRGVEPVDAQDDGFCSYEAALMLRDQGGMRTDVLGASVEELMHRDIAKRTSSGSGRRREKKAKAGEPHPKTARDGREELHPDTRVRRGRPPAYCELGTSIPTARRVAVKMTIAPETLAAILAEGISLVELTERILASHFAA